MYNQSQNQGFPITITFLTKSRTLYSDKINSKASFNSLIENFQKNSQYKSQAKIKNKYLINGKQIRGNQTLEEIILQNMCDPMNCELQLELNDILYSGDIHSSVYKKIIHPKDNPFGLFVYSTKEGMLSLHNFEEKTINLFELDKINSASAYCNSNEDFYISGSNGKDDKNFWIINNNDFTIKKKNMPFGKQNHSMIYLNFNENEEWVFITGGNNKKTFYYDLNKNYFINWGDTIDPHQNPALIRIGEYLYILDALNTKKNYWERTKIISPNRKWEKTIPKIDKKLLANFPNEFAVSYDINGHILFIGGNNILNSNSTYVYNPLNNEITLSKNGTNDNETFADKFFYKINNKYNVAIPKNINEQKEICVVNKDEQALIKINIDIPNDYKKTKIKSRINFDDKKLFDNKNDEGTLIIKELDNKVKGNNNLMNNNYMNQIIQAQYICENCAGNNNSICQICHKSLQKNNFDNKYQRTIKHNPTRQNPYIEKIHDDYYPTFEKKYGRTYGNYKENRKVRVEVIYDEYTPIKVNYELGKPYQYKYVKPKKIEESKNAIEEPKNIIEEPKNITEEININNNENNINIKNDNKVNIVQEDNKENNQQIEENIIESNEVNQQNEENNIETKENEINNINQEQQEKMEEYINQEENVEIENEEEHYEEHYEEKNEEYNEQVEEEHNYYKHYSQKQLDEAQQNEVLRDSLEVNEIKKEKEKEKDIDNEIIKPIFKLDFGFKDDYEDKSDNDFNIIKGLKLKFDNENESKVNIINSNINIEKSNEINNNQENIIIKGEEENQNIEQNNEEEVHYENHENDENENIQEEGGEYNNEQGEEEINFEENCEEMRYEEQEENDNENGEEQNEVIKIGQEGENENEEHYINEEHEEEN